MIRRWILYLATVSGCVVFYWAYREWFSWFALVGVLCFPVAALLMSLPAMINLKMKVDCPSRLGIGEKADAGVVTYSKLPAPPVTYRVAVTRTVTGETWLLKPGDSLPTDHCGQLVCKPARAKVYDYLGLFFLKVQKRNSAAVLVRPVSLAMRQPAELQRFVASSWRPRPGGGFSENHELRLYRPGDNLNQVHWKLSAKMGKYIVREPMEPEKSRVFLNMVLRGSPEELDRKFGRLLWLSRYLLETGLKHELRVLTGEGAECLPVDSETALEKAMDRLLCCPPAPEGRSLEPVAASWQYEIGGGLNEA